MYISTILDSYSESHLAPRRVCDVALIKDDTRSGVISFCYRKALNICRTLSRSRLMIVKAHQNENQSLHVKTGLDNLSFRLMRRPRLLVPRRLRESHSVARLWHPRTSETSDIRTQPRP